MTDEGTWIYNEMTGRYMDL